MEYGAIYREHDLILAFSIEPMTNVQTTTVTIDSPSRISFPFQYRMDRQEAVKLRLFSEVVKKNSADQTSSRANERNRPQNEPVAASASDSQSRGVLESTNP